MLRIFISWSRERSYRVALAWKDLLGMFQSVELMMSEDVECGGPVLPSLNVMLKKADFAVMCMTEENWEEPWIFYETGVVFGKSEAHVCPYIIDLHMKRRNLPEPLKQFRAVMATREGTFQLVCKINSLLENPLSDAQLRRSFNARWPRFNKVLKEVQAEAPPRTQKPNSEHIDRSVCFNDSDVVRDCIDSHHDYLIPHFRDCIDLAIEAGQSNSYEQEKFVELVHREISISKRRFKDTSSILVGNVSDFFSNHFSTDYLREIIASMEPDLRLSPSPQVARDRLNARMEIAMRDRFRLFHRVREDKLRECLEK